MFFLLTMTGFSAHVHGQYAEEPPQKPSTANQNRESVKTRESLARTGLVEPRSMSPAFSRAHSGGANQSAVCSFGLSR